MRDVVQSIDDVYGVRDVSLDFTEEVSRTSQEFRDECDINRIVKQAEKTGLVTHLNSKSVAYMDISHMPDFQTMHNIVIQAQNEFSSVPAEIRQKFNNDPMVFFEAVSENPKLLVELGLASAEKVELDIPKAAEQVQEVINQAAPPA